MEYFEYGIISCQVVFIIWLLWNAWTVRREERKRDEDGKKLTEGEENE